MKINNKGITLVALIITIVILLILAVVTIKSVQNDGIIKYAQNSVDRYGQEQINEGTIIDNYTDRMESNTTKGRKISFTIDNATGSGGGTVQPAGTFYAEEGMTWRKWVNSEYFPDGLKPVKLFRVSITNISYGLVAQNNTLYTIEVNPDAEIKENGVYTYWSYLNYSSTDGWD